MRVLCSSSSSSNLVFYAQSTIAFTSGWNALCNGDKMLKGDYYTDLRYQCLQVCKKRKQFAALKWERGRRVGKGGKK